MKQIVTKIAELEAKQLVDYLNSVHISNENITHQTRKMLNRKRITHLFHSP